MGWVSFRFPHHDPTQFMILQLQNIQKCTYEQLEPWLFIFYFFIHPPTHGSQLEGSICSKDCFLFQQAFLKGVLGYAEYISLDTLTCFTHMLLLHKYASFVKHILFVPPLPLPPKIIGHLSLGQDLCVDISWLRKRQRKGHSKEKNENKKCP